MKLRPYFKIHENGVFQVFNILKKTPVKKTFFVNFQTRFISHIDSWHILRHFGALSKKRKSATLGQL